ncbi:Ingression protein fic1 [Sphaceloma murrayae]|uniref:Ingression protein fic1 n=1 Tax=Sphaceloma murrayae TaxID=2082308 RepID=A0A2K1QVS0_9PEZI|nr:Ingression protein fic1 [Sphaceloma murrayae]
MTSRLGLMGGQHTAGLYADMTVDGPEIGTLVVIVDRAKNLPNRRTMGKQDPYCAARLGKEAKKTTTDVRGGQTPRWDQELRFTVHESPDYYNLKVSVFNDDKKTDLIGETYVGLKDKVIVSGGGRHDGWHSLNYKGKYAGEVRIEMSYYDSRAPERPLSTDTTKKKSPVKRRPLPTGPSQVVTPQFGPRPLGCARGETVFLDPEGNPTEPPPEPVSEDAYPEGQYNPHQPDFLPQIPPSSRHRGSLPPHHSQMTLAHSHSAPDVHSVYSDSHYPADENEYHPGLLEFASATNSLSDLNGQWEQQSVAPSHHDIQSWHGSQLDTSELPPLPPSHSNTPTRDRHGSFDQQSYVSSTSPLQQIERYGSSPQNRAMSEYGTPHRTSAGPSPLRREVPAPGQPTHSHPHSSPVSPFSRSVGSSPGMPPYPLDAHPGITRHSVSDPFAAVTPPRANAHPLSQEVRRSVSPQPYAGQPGYADPQTYHFPEDTMPIIKPRAQPSPRARHSIASIQHPVSTFASQNTPSSAPHAHPRGVAPLRKSVSPAASPNAATSTGGIPFGPDDFAHLNPSSRTSQLDHQPSPHNPYHIPAAPAKGAPLSGERNTADKIVGFDGREIDPSDHLPVEAWAPEPEVKQGKTYGARGEGRGFGPRTTASAGAIKVNVRTRRMGESPISPSAQSPGGGMSPSSMAGSSYGGSDGASMAGSPASPTKDGRNRLVKKNGPFVSAARQGPLREIEAPNPYGYDRGGAAPPKPPKIPMNATVEDEASERYGYGTSALSREMAKIDIGGIGARRGFPGRQAVGMVRYGS